MKRAVPAVVSILGAALLVVAAAPTGSASVNPHRGVVAERPRDAAVHAMDGEVHSVAQVGTTVVMGGTFTKVGPVTRGAVGIVDTTAGSFQATFPDVVGVVRAVASDGAGGWYVGGQFSSVAGQSRTNLAHVDAAGSVTGWAPNPNGVVYALVANPVGGIFVGGDFTTLGGATANRLVSIAAGDTVAWVGNVTGAGGGIRSLALSADSSVLYLGGLFARIDGITMNRLGAVNAATGTRNATFAPGTVNNTVNDLAVNGSSLLVAGDFTAVNGTTRNRLASLDGATGALGSLNVTINASVKDIELDAAANTLYVGGSFATVAGSARVRVAGVNLGTGAATSLSLTNLTGTVNALALDGAGGLFIAGPLQITPERDNPANLAKIDIANSTATSVVPYAETPRSLARTPVGGTSGPTLLRLVGGTLLVAGDFSDYGSREQKYLAAYDLTTGALRTGFNPAPDAMVFTVKASADNTAFFAGGEFTTVAGATATRIAKLSITDGTPVAGFSASANSYVKDMAVRADGTAVYAGGNFNQFNGAAVSRLTAFDPTTGATSAGFSMDLTEPTNENSEGGLRAMALSDDQTRLMVIGNFMKIAGQTRPLVGQIDVSSATATVTDWHTDLYNQPCARGGKVGWMRDVDISPDNQTVFVVSAGHFYYPACDTVNAFPMAGAGASEVSRLWSTKIGDTLEAVAANQDALYISGHFRYLDTETKSEPRFQIAALDPATGKGINWVPDAGGLLGVRALEIEPAGLFAGSDGDAFGGINHGRNAFWPTPATGLDVRKQGDRRWVLAPSGTVNWTMRVMNTFTDRSVDLTSLTDSVLGNLAGQGTCSVPQTIAVGGSYSCTVSQTVSGTALTQTDSGTVTATGTPAGGGTVTDTDRALVDVFSSMPTFRARVVLGPNSVEFPGRVIRFSVTLMNLDPLRTATATSLTSPTFGDVSAACGLPAPIPPNGIVYCHLDRAVSGTVGSVTSYSFTGTAQFDTGSLTSTGSQSVTITPPVGGSKVAMVVQNPAVPTGNDTPVLNRLQANYTVRLVDDDTFTAADVAADESLVIIGPSAAPAKIGTKFTTMAIPAIVLHSQNLDEMDMTAVGANGTTAAQTQVNVTTWMHPLSVARSGTLTLNSSALNLAWGTPAAAATVITTTTGGQPTEFAYKPGQQMTTIAAPSCRVFFAAQNPTRFTTDAWTLFDRAVAYSVYNCGKGMLWTAAGNGTTSYGTGDGRASVAVGLNTPWGTAFDSQGRLYVADSGTHSIRRIDTDGRVYTVAGTGTSGSTGDGGPATSARLNAPVRLAFDTADNLYVADSGNHKIRKITPAGIISTVAGNGQQGNQGDGGQATAARLRTPYDMVIAPDGTMYIADRANNKIRRVTPAGVISTFAGNGTSGYNGDGIAATSARLQTPYGVALDAAGNLYIADYDNERVRVVSGGIINTVAGTGIATADGDGGPAVEAGLHKPQYLTFLPNGDLLIAESNNNDVRLVHDGQITTLAGTRQFGYAGDGGSPIFSTWQRPSAISVDAQGTIWIADRQNRRIRVISTSS